MNNEMLSEFEVAIQKVRNVVSALSDEEKEFLRRNSVGYRQMHTAFTSDAQDRLNAAQARVAGHIEHIKSLEAEVEQLRAIKFKRFNNEDCWIYQGDGGDHLESLACPVVMSAQQVMKFEAALARVAELEQFVSQLASYRMPPADESKEYAWQNRLYTIRTDARKLMGVEDQ